MAHAAVASAVGPHPDCPVAAFHGHPRAGTLFEFRQQWFTEMQLKKWFTELWSSFCNRGEQSAVSAPSASNYFSH
jgi:hypothetical protein